MVSPIQTNSLFMFYWMCLRHPDDGNEYDRNMLVINSLLFIPTNAHTYIKILNYIKNAFVYLFVFGARVPGGPGPPHSRGF